MIAKNVIKPTQTEWASPFVLAPQKDGTLPPVHRLPKACAVTIWDSYLILCTRKLIDLPEDATIFSMLDAKRNGKAKFAQQGRDKSAFNSRSGLFSEYSLG